MKVTATEKKLVEAYRDADTKTRKAAMDLLKGKDSAASALVSNLLDNIFKSAPDKPTSRWTTLGLSNKFSAFSMSFTR